jgi:hypothetical protein
VVRLASLRLDDVNLHIKLTHPGRGVRVESGGGGGGGGGGGDVLPRVSSSSRWQSRSSGGAKLGLKLGSVKESNFDFFPMPELSIADSKGNHHRR